EARATGPSQARATHPGTDATAGCACSHAGRAATRAVPGGRKDRVLQPGYLLPELARGTGEPRAREDVYRQEADREQRQAEEAGGRSAEAADRRLDAERRRAHAAREGHREAAGRQPALPAGRPGRDPGTAEERAG